MFLLLFPSSDSETLPYQTARSMLCCVTSPRDDRDCDSRQYFGPTTKGGCLAPGFCGAAPNPAQLHVQQEEIDELIRIFDS